MVRSLILPLLMTSMWAGAQTTASVGSADTASRATRTGADLEGPYSITITVTNIRNHDGVIRFKFYDDSTPFPHEKGFRRVVVPKSQVVGDSLTVKYNGFWSQNMGIALLDDENNNWELDMGWFFPKEGHAFSDYYHTAMRRPLYKDFAFPLTGDKKVVMKVRYY